MIASATSSPAWPVGWSGGLHRAWRFATREWSGCGAVKTGRARSCCSTEGRHMRTLRWVAGAVVLCTLAGCKHWDGAQPPGNVPDGDDCKQYSVKEAAAIYANFLPPRGFYEVFAVLEPPD